MKDFPVTNTGVSLVRHTFSLKWFWGVGKWKASPSSSNSISSQGINSLCHQKSFRKKKSTCAHAAQANLSLAGLQNVLKRVCSSFSKKVLPQLAGSQMKMFLFFPLPDINMSHTAPLNSATGTLFIWRASLTHSTQVPWHSATHSGRVLLSFMSILGMPAV